MKNRYSASVIGAGMGGTLSIDALVASERFELVAVADIREDALVRVHEQFPNVRVFDNHQEMFAQCPTDVVCVSIWPPDHLSATLDALELPLTGILVEKPLADTAVAGKALLEAVQRSGIPMVVPHGLLVADHSRQILDLVYDGAIGDLVLAEIECSGWDIINAGIHWLDYFVTLIGLEPVEWVIAACDASTRTYRDGMQVETLAVTYAQTLSGIRVVMNTGDYVAMTEPGKQTVYRLIGRAGTLEFYGWEPRYRLLNGEYPQGKLFEVKPSPRTNHQRHLEHLAAQMDAGKADYSVAEGSLMALELCEAAYRSCRYGGVVRLPLEKYQPPVEVDWTPGLPYSGSGGGRDGRKLAVK